MKISAPAALLERQQLRAYDALDSPEEFYREHPKGFLHPSTDLESTVVF